MNPCEEKTTGSDGRVRIAVPEEIYRDLLSLASDLDFAANGKVAVLPLIEAMSQVDVEEMYELLRLQGLLPVRRKEI
jgi:hypothetical protein